MSFRPVDVPDLLPLRRSHEANEVEIDLKQLTLALFAESIRNSERELNVYGMPHLGPFELIERIVTGDGLSLYRREDQEAMRYLFKAWKSRNPKRGLIFLKTYLQLLWPNGWSVDQLWHRKNSPYPNGTVRRQDITDADPHTNHYLTSRISVSIFTESEDGNGLGRITPSLRAVLPARLLLFASLLRDFENIGERAIGVANGGTLMQMGFYEGEASMPPIVESTFSRQSTAYDMAYEPVAVDEPVLFGLVDSPMEFSVTTPMPHPFTASTIKYTYEEALASAKAIAAANPGVVRYENLCDPNLASTSPEYAGLTFEGLASAREMPALRINDNGQRPIMLVQTAVHGAETRGVRGIEEFVKQFLTSNSELMTWLRGNVAIYWIVAGNPDGYANVQRRNANGVNLNRNWPFFFDFTPDTDKGAIAGSEIETRNVMKWLTIPRMARIVTAFDVHEWGSRNDYGYLTDYINYDERATRHIRAGLHYTNSLLAQRSFSEFQFTYERPVMIERRASKKPYMIFSIRPFIRPDALSMLAEGAENEPQAGIYMVTVLDTMTGLAMAARDTITSSNRERRGIMVTPAVAAADILNINSHMTSWNELESRPVGFTFERLLTSRLAAGGPDEDTGLTSIRPDEQRWGNLISQPAYGVYQNPATLDGGVVLASGDNAGSTNIGAIESLKPSTGSSATVAQFKRTPLPLLPASFSEAAGAVDPATGKFYVYGGFNGAYQNRLYEIDLNAPTVWVDRGPLALTGVSIGLQRHTMDFVGGFLYIAGGRDSVGYKSSVWRVNVADLTSTVFATLPGNRGWHQSAVLNDLLYIMGGFTGSTTQSTVYTVNLSTAAVATLAALPHSRRQGGAVVRNGVIYIIGGWSGATYRDDWLQFQPGVDSAFTSVTLEYDAEENEHGELIEIERINRLRPAVVYQPFTDEFLVIGGTDPLLANRDSIFVLDPVELTVSLRGANANTWGYVRMAASYPVSPGERYTLLSAARRYPDGQPESAAYVRSALYAGPFGPLQRKFRQPYTVPPNGRWSMQALPLQIASGQTELRAYLRHYAPGTRIDIGAMQLVRNGLSGYLSPQGGKAADNLSLSFVPPISPSGGRYSGVMSPLVGCNQPVDPALTLLDFQCTAGLAYLRLKFFSLVIGDPNILSTYSNLVPQGYFQLEWMPTGGAAMTHNFAVIEVNHDRFTPSWRRDQVSWRIKNEAGQYSFDLWFYNRLQTVALGAVAATITGVTAGAGAVHAA